MDVSHLFPSGMLAKLHEDSWTIAAAVETYAVMRKKDIPWRFAMVADETSEVLEVFVGRLGDTPLLSDFHTKATRPDGSLAVYSALENALYLVGGTNKGIPAGLTRIDLSSGAIEILAGNVFEEVLAATYDPGTKRLFVLERTRTGPGEYRAQLTAFSREIGSAKTYWSVPHLGSSWTLSLAMTEEGDLALVRGDSSTFTAFLYRPKADSAVLIGRLEGKGRVVGRPVLGEHALTLPVIDSSGSLSIRNLHQSDFSAKTPCASL